MHRAEYVGADNVMILSCGRTRYLSELRLPSIDLKFQRFQGFLDLGVSRWQHLRSKDTANTRRPIDELSSMSASSQEWSAHVSYPKAIWHAAPDERASLSPTLIVLLDQDTTKTPIVLLGIGEVSYEEARQRRGVEHML